MTASRKLLAASGATTAFSPDDIAGLVGWYDPSDDANVTIATGISQIDDLSASGNHLLQADTTKQPSHGTVAAVSGGTLKVIQFDGSNDVLLTSGTMAGAPSTWFAVAAKPTTDNTDVLIRMDGHATYLASGGSQLTTWSGSTGVVWSSTSTDSTDDHVHALVLETTQFSYFIDGTQKSTTTSCSNLTDEAFIVGADGSSGSAAGDWYVGEIVVYDSALDSADRAAVEDYLATKWGTP